MTRDEAIAVLQEEIDGNLELTLREWRERDEQRLFPALRMAIEALMHDKSLPSAEAVSRYAEWLEKIIVDNEGANEWLCEDTPDLEWCKNNCHYSSIQAECLRHLYEVSKGGAE